MDVKNDDSAGESERVAQGRATRRALVAAGRDEFGGRGYADTSVEDIVQRAEVTKGAFYHHFSGKKELFRRVFEQVTRDLSRAAFVTHVEHEPFRPREEQTRETRPFQEQSNREVWRQLLERCRRYIELRTDPQVQRITMVDALWLLSREERRAVEEEQGVVLLRADLRRAQRRGIVQPLPLHTLAVLLNAALDEACMLVVDAASRDEALDEAISVLEAFLEGVRTEQPLEEG